MSRTVTALYDTRAEAEAARQRLAAEVQLGSANILDQKSHEAGGSQGSLNRLPLSNEDRSTFHEGIRRGGFLLTAEVTGHEDADKIVRLLEESASVDLDRRQEQWRSDGWAPAQPAQPKAAPSSEQVIPIIEEELVVGRREVDRGGARVRSYVRDVPVHEEVTLREEHVSVERRRLDQPLGAAGLDGDLLRERDVEVTAKAEEAVVSKEAHVREEVVVSKRQEQHVEQVEAEVARTEVAVDEGPAPLASSSPNDRPQPATGVNLMPETDRTIPPVIPQEDTTLTTGAPMGDVAPFPTGGASAVQQPRVVGRESVEQAPPIPAPRTDTIVTERRTSSRPSTALIIGSAVAGAIAGGAIPFMLAGRKKETREVLLIEDHSPSAPVGHPTREFVRGGRQY